jgi:tellurite resistance protein TehA-like permease
MVEAEKKNPQTAAIASFLIPGLGQVYEGESPIVGLFWLVGTIVGLLFCFIPGIAVWLYGIYNAHHTAELMNSGQLPQKATKPGDVKIFAIIGIIVYAICLIIIILIALAVIGILIYGKTRY